VTVCFRSSTVTVQERQRGDGQLLAGELNHGEGDGRRGGFGIARGLLSRFFLAGLAKSLLLCSPLPASPTRLVNTRVNDDDDDVTQVGTRPNTPMSRLEGRMIAIVLQ
jgi:hypothetical protein